MKRIRLLVALTVFMGLMATTLVGTAVAQTSQQVQDGVNAIGGQNSPSMEMTIESGINTFLYIIGALSVIMIIYGGFKYITSAGDPTGVTSAKNTIMYAVIGLVVTVLAGFIARFTVGIFNGDAPLTAEQCQQIPAEQRYHEEECL